MNKIKILINRHVVYCPKCKHELYIDAISNETHQLRCKNPSCNAYYRRNRKNKEIVENGSYLDLLEDLKKRGMEEWPGIPTSKAYAPFWVKFVRMFIR